jgi:hypothetical protein
LPEPASCSDRPVPIYTPEHKRRIAEWTNEGLFRASIGLKSTRDLIVDLDQALSRRTFNGLVGLTFYSVRKQVAARVS